MAVAEALAHYGAVLGLRQAVVVRTARAKQGELDAEFSSRAGYPVVDVLRARVEAADREGEAFWYSLDHRQQVGLGEPLASGHAPHWGTQSTALMG